MKSGDVDEEQALARAIAWDMWMDALKTLRAAFQAREGSLAEAVVMGIDESIAAGDRALATATEFVRAQVARDRTSG